MRASCVVAAVTIVVSCRSESILSDDGGLRADLDKAQSASDVRSLAASVDFGIAEPDVVLALGDACLRVGEYEAAIAAYRRLASLPDHEADARLNVINARVSQGEMDLATAELEEALPGKVRMNTRTPDRPRPPALQSPRSRFRPLPAATLVRLTEIYDDYATVVRNHRQLATIWCGNCAAGHLHDLSESQARLRIRVGSADQACRVLGELAAGRTVLSAEASPEPLTFVAFFERFDELGRLNDGVEFARGLRSLSMRTGQELESSVDLALAVHRNDATAAFVAIQAEGGHWMFKLAAASAYRRLGKPGEAMVSRGIDVGNLDAIWLASALGKDPFVDRLEQRLEVERDLTIREAIKTVLGP